MRKRTNRWLLPNHLLTNLPHTSKTRTTSSFDKWICVQLLLNECFAASFLLKLTQKNTIGRFTRKNRSVPYPSDDFDAYSNLTSRGWIFSLISKPIRLLRGDGVSHRTVTWSSHKCLLRPLRIWPSCSPSINGNQFCCPHPKNEPIRMQMLYCLLKVMLKYPFFFACSLHLILSKFGVPNASCFPSWQEKGGVSYEM